MYVTNFCLNKVDLDINKTRTQMLVYIKLNTPTFGTEGQKYNGRIISQCN